MNALSAVLRRELRVLWRALRATWPWLAGAAVLSALVVIALFRADPEILAAIQVGEGTPQRLAHGLETFGRAEWGTLFLGAVIFGLGLAFRSRRLRRAAVAAVVAGLLAGVLVNLLRPAIGRARPDDEIANGIYGPSIDHAYNSLPSGHAMSNSATVMAAARVCRPLLVPAVVYSGAMAWSRLEMDDHHLSDVIAGTLLGWSVGIWVGYAVVRRKDLLAAET